MEGISRAAVRRAVVVAAIVGTILVVINQADHLNHLTPGLAAKIALTYLTPFVVSLVGWRSAVRAGVTEKGSGDGG